MKEQPVILTGFLLLHGSYADLILFLRHGSSMSISCIAYRPIILFTDRISKRTDSFNNTLHNIPGLKKFRRNRSSADSCRRSCCDDRSRFKVMPFGEFTDHFSIPWIKGPVLEFWRSSPFYFDWIFNTGGNAVESTVMIPRTKRCRNPSGALSKYHCLYVPSASLALASFMIV